MSKQPTAKDTLSALSSIKSHLRITFGVGISSMLVGAALVFYVLANGYGGGIVLGLILFTGAIMTSAGACGTLINVALISLNERLTSLEDHVAECLVTSSKETPTNSGSAEVAGAGSTD